MKTLRSTHLFLCASVLLLTIAFCAVFMSGCRTQASLNAVLADLEARQIVQAPESWSINGSDWPTKRVSLSGGVRKVMRNGVSGWEDLELVPDERNGEIGIWLFLSRLPDDRRSKETLWENFVPVPKNEPVSSVSFGPDFLPCQTSWTNAVFVLYLVQPDFVVFAWPSPETTHVFDLEVSSCYRVFQINRFRDRGWRTTLKEMIVEGERKRKVREAEDRFRAFLEGRLKDDKTTSHGRSAAPAPLAEFAESAESLEGRAPSRPEGGSGAPPPSVAPPPAP